MSTTPKNTPPPQLNVEILSISSTFQRALRIVMVLNAVPNVLNSTMQWMRKLRRRA